jgi:glycine cleavage system transcriptional repressor
MVQRSSLTLSYLAISWLGQVSQTSLCRMHDAIAESSCTIIRSQLNQQDDIFAGYLFIAGKWNHIAKVETLLNHLAKELSLQIQLARYQLQKSKEAMLTYAVYVLGLDSPGILAKLNQFFINEQALILEVTSDTFLSKHSQLTMFSISMQLALPAAMPASDMRDNFMLLCDDLNLEGFIELDN